MKAAFVKNNKVRIKDISLPSPKKNEVLVRIDACGVCGTDFIEAKAWAKDWKRFGHEIAATVTEVGSGVTGLAVGEQVVIALSVPCGACIPCRRENYRKCNCLILVEQGGFAEYLLIKDQRLLYKVTPPLPAELACFAEPLTVILDAFHLANLHKDDHFLVVGGGNIGSMALLAANALGVNVQGVLSRKTNPGLMTCLNMTGGEFFTWRMIAGLTIAAPTMLQQKLSELSGRVVVLHTAPPCYITDYLGVLPFDSTIVNIGISASPKKNRLKIDASKLIFKRLQIMSAFPVPCMHFPQAISLLQEHFHLFSLLPTEQVPLEQLPEVINKPKRQKGKILIITR
jgi:threonine dehydrogenase-like Zn-dependent dehydrogenase